MLVERLFRKLIQKGRLTVIGHDGKTTVFEGDPGPEVTICLHAPGAGRRIALNPTLGTAETYMEGLLTVEDGNIYDFLDLTAMNIGHGHLPAIHGRLKRLGLWTRHYMQRNSLPRARRNVTYHYDLSGELYDLFLDSRRQYSCAYFVDGEQDLDRAQLAKMHHIAAKLLLAPGQKVLDIGCGWGGLARFLAGQEDVTVRGLTLSEEQYRHAGAMARQAGLDDRLAFALQDYRLEESTYDRIVSVGMFEHVGVDHYGEYFDTLCRLLAADGVALIHTIGRSDGPGLTEPFMRKYIFPGGYIPALSEMMPAIERSGLVITDIEVLRLHYAETLRAWRRHFRANWERAKSLYDERFCRMWEFYLAGSEVAFRYLGMVVFHIQMARRQDAVPLTRDYLADAERRRGGASMAAE